MGRRRRTDQRRTGKAKRPRSQRQARGGLTDKARCNLEPYKAEIAQLLQKPTSKNQIAKHLREVYGTRASYQTLCRQLDRWGLAPIGSAKQGKVLNINPFEGEFTVWQEEGLDTATMVSNFKARHGKVVTKHTVDAALARWGSRAAARWRRIETQHVPDPEIPALPIDLLGTARGVLEQKIRAAYAGDQEFDDLEAEWVQRLAAAACYDRQVQRTIVKETLQPGHHWSSSRCLSPLWALGIHLPGCYQHPRADTAAKITSLVELLTPRVLEEVAARLTAHLAEAITVARREGDPDLDTALSVIPVTVPPRCVVDLLQACQSEIDEAALEQDINSQLRSLGLQQLPAVLHGQDRPGCPTLESWTREVDRLLCTWDSPGTTLCELPALTDREMQVRDPDTLSEDGSEGGDDEDEEDDDSNNEINENGDEETDNETDETDKTDKETIADRDKGTDSETDDEPMDIRGESYTEDQSRRSGNGNDSDSGPGSPYNGMSERGHNLLYTLLAQMVRMRIPQPLVFKSWLAPTGGALLGSPPSRFGTTPWAASPALLPGPGVRGTPLRYRREGATALGDATAYLSDLSAAQTPDERRAYQATCRRMSSCTSRPERGRKLYSLWSSAARDDNWWHCRRLLQRLCLEGPARQLEYRLMLVLAAFESGSTDGTVWIPALEGNLRQLAQSVGGEVGAGLVEELTIFAHGVALNSLTLRFYSHRLSGNKIHSIPPWDMQTWYTILYNADWMCASPTCAQALPHPQEFTTPTLTDLFSIGSRDNRAGCRRFRRFISRDRQEAYPCLVTWIRTREPHPALVAAFLWFGRLFHTDTSCRFGRGKWAETF